MTEDMRKRLIGTLLDAWDGVDNSTKSDLLDQCPSLHDALQALFAAVESGQFWEAALSSAGTSGTLFPLGSLMQVGSGTIADPYFVVVDRSICGGSLSGKGETMNKTHTPDCDRSVPSAPDRAEELARLRATIDQVLCRRIKHIGDVDQLYTGYPNQLIDELVTAVAGREMGRWIPVSERLPERLVIVKAKGYDMPFVAELLRTKLGEPIIREGGYQWKIQSPFAVGLTSEVTHWCDAALPAPPREEG